MKREAWSETERDLLIELCRYHAQALFAARNHFDFDDVLPKVELPKDGALPEGTILLDAWISAYEAAAYALQALQFAVSTDIRSDAIKLVVSTDQFKIPADLELGFNNRPSLGEAFSAIFRIYDQGALLGHPDTLQRIFNKLPEAGLIEERYGYPEWSRKALDFTYPRRRAGLPYAESDFLWVIDTFDWYVEEAARKWS